MPVAQPYISATVLGYIRIMSYENNRTPFGMKFLKQDQYFKGSTRIQISGSFVSQNNSRIVYQCPGNSDSLHLSPRHLIRFMFQPVT